MSASSEYLLGYTDNQGAVVGVGVNQFSSVLTRDLFLRVVENAQRVWRFYYFHDASVESISSFDELLSDVISSPLNLVYDSFIRLMASSNIYMFDDLNDRSRNNEEDKTCSTVNESSSPAATSVSVNGVDDVNSCIAGVSSDSYSYRSTFNYDVVRLLRDRFHRLSEDRDRVLSPSLLCSSSSSPPPPPVSTASSRASNVGPSSSSYVVTPKRLYDAVNRRYYGFVETHVKCLTDTFLREYVVQTNASDLAPSDAIVRLTCGDGSPYAMLNQKNTQSPSTQSTRRLSVHQEDVSEIQDSSSTSIFLASIKMLNLFQSLYRFRLDLKMFDHSRHYDESFIPFFRFPFDSRRQHGLAQATRQHSLLTFVSMTNFVGNTMRKNIRSLYDYIWTLLGDDETREVCPCVVIYNIFIRDYFRMFHSRSLSPTNFVLVYDDHAASDDPCKFRKISYVQLSNRFPRVSQWFRSINNQFVKKNGFSRIFKLNDYIELFEVALDSSINDFVSVCSSPVCDRANVVTTDKRSSASSRKIKRLSRVGSNSLSSRKDRVLGEIGVGCVRKKTGLSGMMKKTRCNDMLSQLYRSGYKLCPHNRTKRLYIQKRSHDESASVVIFCEDCRNFI